MFFKPKHKTNGHLIWKSLLLCADLGGIKKKKR